MLFGLRVLAVLLLHPGNPKPLRSTRLTQKLQRAAARRLPLPSPEERLALRLAAGLSQRDVAEVLSDVLGRTVDRGAVSRWEGGLRTPRGDSYAAYQALLVS